MINKILAIFNKQIVKLYSLHTTRTYIFIKEINRYELVLPTVIIHGVKESVQVRVPLEQAPALAYIFFRTTFSPSSCLFHLYIKLP